MFIFPPFFEKMAPTLWKLLALNEEQFLLIVSLIVPLEAQTASATTPMMGSPSILVIM